jgi:hypothetical protein
MADHATVVINKCGKRRVSAPSTQGQSRKFRLARMISKSLLRFGIHSLRISLKENVQSKVYLNPQNYLLGNYVDFWRSWLRLDFTIVKLSQLF